MLDFLENWHSTVLKYLRAFNWWSILNIGLVIVLTLLNAFYVIGTLVAYSYDITIQGLSQWGIFAYLISIVGLGYYVEKYLNLKRLLQLVMGYMIYLSVSYFLLLTAFINRPDFKPEKTFGNDFWEIRYLLTIVLIIIVAGLIKIARHHWDWAPIPHIEVSPNLLISSFLVVAVLCDSRLLDVTITSLSPALSTGEPNQIFREMLLIIWRMLTYFWPIAYLTVKGLSDLRYNKSSLSLAISSSLFFALIFNYTLQLGVKGDGAFYGYYVYEGAILYQILFLFTFFILFYCLVNRYILATILIASVGTIASVINAMKVAMRSEPLLITDLVWLKQLDLLFGFVDKSFIFNLILAILGISLVYVIASRFLLKGSIIKNIFLRLALVMGLLIFINRVMTVFRNEDFNKIEDNIPVLSTLNNLHDINWLGFEYNARLKSVAFVWSKQLSKHLMAKPDSYSEETVNRIVAKYTDLAKTMNQERTAKIQDQTVIYILSESFANPNHLDGIHLTDNPIPFIEQLSTQTTSGLMKSDFYGGGTANMEFQSLTSLPFYNYSSSIAIAYTEIVPKLKYMPSISQHFKPDARIAMHPANAKNYDRYGIYKKLDFDKFFAAKGTSDKFTNPTPVGVYMGDNALYRNILEQLDTKKNQFFSIITMQNHTPWSAATPEHLTGTGEGFSDTENTNLTNYARLLYNTDKATENFLDDLSKIDKKITVVFYGDHLPGLYPAETFKNRPETQYQSDYFIWSNFDDNHLNYPLLNSSDFTAALLEQTNAKVTPYYALMTEILKKASVDKDRETLSDEAKAIADDLRLVQYDLASGKGYLLKHLDFFEKTPK